MTVQGIDESGTGNLARRTPAGGVRRRYRPGGTWWPFALPALVLVAAFFVLPFILNLRLAFTDWSSFSDEINWNGLDNFQLLIEQNILTESLRVTLIYAVVAMLLQNVVSLSLALLLEETNFINSVFRSVFFLPVLISSVAAGYIWFALLAPNGPFNQAIARVIPGFSHAWFGETSTALVAVAFTDVWKSCGIVTLVYIAGLNAIPHELSEAATIDGASAWQRFWKIRFPLLAPALTFTVVTTLIGAINAFDIAMATTRGGPGTATMVLNLAMQQQWQTGFFGTGSALSLTLTLIVVLTAVPLVMYLRSREVAL
jgi:multiple sugar transport system permease protein/raffinose/stachyose/melibiose transport system permease protein